MTPGKWRKSSRSAAQGQCVETRMAASFEVRDSKLGDASPVLAMSAGDFAGLLTAVR